MILNLRQSLSLVMIGRGAQTNIGQKTLTTSKSQLLELINYEFTFFGDRGGGWSGRSVKLDCIEVVSSKWQTSRQVDAKSYIHTKIDMLLPLSFRTPSALVNRSLYTHNLLTPPTHLRVRELSNFFNLHEYRILRSIIALGAVGSGLLS